MTSFFIGFFLGAAAMYWLMTWKPWDSPPIHQQRDPRNPPKTFGRGGG